MLARVSSDGAGIGVRPLAAADAGSVAPLLAQLGYPTEVGEARARIETWSQAEAGVALGAEVGGLLVGFVAVYVVPRFEVAGARARIVALAVDEAHRGRGVGAALLDAARSFAAERGAVQLEAMSRGDRADAHGFYEARGFSDVTARSRRFMADL
jgi:GNAT superfamily N-acetyltransferase